MVSRLPIVGVMGSGADGWPRLSDPLGRALAARPVHLLTGGGGGVMAAVAESFCAVPHRAGLSIAIVPLHDGGMGNRYPNPFCELVIPSGLPRFDPAKPDRRTRNHMNIEMADIILALPGGQGTRHEMELAQLAHKPLLACGPKDRFDPVPDHHVTLMTGLVDWLDDQIARLTRSH